MAVVRAVRIGSLLFSSCRATSSHAHRPDSVRIRTYIRAGSESTADPFASLTPLPSLVSNKTRGPASAVPNNSVRGVSPKLPAEPGDTSGRCGSGTPAIQVVFEDEHLIAVNKPPGIMVHSSREATREERAQGAFVKDMVERQLGLDHPLFPAHRIDRPASGALVFGRTAEACRRVRAAMAHPAAVKEYLVLVRGSPPDAFTCDKPLKDDKGVVKRALSQFRKLLEIPQHRCSLLSVRISTGRRHQIRRHLNHLAFHVIGDSVHGKGRTNAHFRKTHRLPPSRLFLHASRLLLPLPALQPESPLMHAPEAESPLFTTPEAEYPLIHALAALEGDSAPLLPPGNEFPPSLPLEGEPFFFPALPIQSTLEPTVGRDGGFLEIVAPLPDDLIQVLLSLGLDIDPINGLNFSYSVPESPPHLVLRE